jgi:hypothetical protein
MMPDKIPTYHVSAVYADNSGLGSYLQSEWGANRAFLRGGGGEERPSRLARLRLFLTPKPTGQVTRSVRAKLPARTSTE